MHSMSFRNESPPPPHAIRWHEEFALAHPLVVQVLVNKKPVKAWLHPASIFSAISTKVWKETRHSDMPLLSTIKPVAWSRLPPPPFPTSCYVGLSACEFEFQRQPVTLQQVLVFNSSEEMMFLGLDFACTAKLKIDFGTMDIK